MGRRPAVFAALAALVMIIIAIPFFSMRLGSADAGTDPSNTTTRKAYDLLARGFGPGYNGPLELVAQVNGPAQVAAFTKVAQAGRRRRASSAPPACTCSRQGPRAADGRHRAASTQGSPQAASTTDAAQSPRDQVIPAATKGRGCVVLVGGTTAIFEDFSQVLSAKLPLFVGIVVLLSFLLLMAVFRSLVIPLIAAVMNLLSAGAAFGIIVAIFQKGWLAGQHHRADRDVHPGADIPDPVRPVDGLRGVPGQPDLRGVAPRGDNKRR